MSVVIGLFAIIVLVIGLAVWSGISNAIDENAELVPVTNEDNPDSLSASDNTQGHPASDANDGGTSSYWEAEQG